MLVTVYIGDNLELVNDMIIGRNFLIEKVTWVNVVTNITVGAYNNAAY